MKADLACSWFSSLTKILPDAPAPAFRCARGETLRGERFNFQLMLFSCPAWA